MKLGWTDPVTGAFNKASSVQLANSIKTSDDEARRKACWEVRLRRSCEGSAWSGWVWFSVGVCSQV